MRKGSLILLFYLLFLSVQAQTYVEGWDMIARSTVKFLESIKPQVEEDFAKGGFDMQFTPYYNGNKKISIIYTLNNEVFESYSDLDIMLPHLKDDLISLITIAFKDDPDGLKCFREYMIKADGSIGIIFESKINGSFLPKTITINPYDL